MFKRGRPMTTALLSILLAATLASAQDTPTGAAESFADSLAIGSDAQSVETELATRCGRLASVTPTPVRFPLARDHEQHFVCDSLTTQTGDHFERAVFTLADGALAQIEVRGDTAPLTANAGESFALGDWTAYPDAAMVIDAAAGTAHLLSEDGLHTNLFAWHNPLMDDEPLDYGPLAIDVPPQVRPGESIETLRAEIEAVCPVVQVREIEPPSLPTEPQTQTQINCFGYETAGFERKIEYVFGDGRLVLAWILTGRGEGDRLEAAMDAAYGEPDFAGESFRFYDGGAAALRFDKPEILFVERTLGAGYMAQLAAQASAGSE